MNPRLGLLQPYPFEKLRALYAGVEPPANLRPVSLSIGEPKHATPAFIEDAVRQNLSGLSSYPPTKGSPALRAAIAGWLQRRYGLPAVDPDTQVLPVLGSREALFAFAQLVVDDAKRPRVLCPNPFYQIYEGAALLAGGRPTFVNADPARNFGCDWSSVSDEEWNETRLVYVCSPGNPAGNVMDLEEWKYLFEQADKYGFVIASDECYSEIYLDESQPPLGALEAAHRLGRTDFHNIVVFSSLSKRSNVPGMRSGFVAGDAKLLARFLLYRTYHGSAMSAVVAAASIAAWNDEEHVRENRRMYREKFEAVLPILQDVLDVQRPQASFYLWPRTPIDDAEFARGLLAQENVTALPGSFLARETRAGNPGANRLRLALVAPLDECVEAAHRLARYARSLAAPRTA
ncbi:succinyldiaminopimelate transaminase [Pigmentiphaga sp.]|jgi:succinyldiaminopimelate transaminase|uniref:succinyldiaminopimelate transaminase n=1 Tax=Pigmentiphaga sp. TaxID=1977564 RepID=UPI0025DC695B|nr:succinyldiaminopimelate transaminase [Pigmentiphaga sp.]MBX6318123.1 succinyldiaminopimelate transaminase [Pigmentiphaga sp.]